MNPVLEGTAALVADMLFDRKVVKFAGVDDSPDEGFRLKLHEKNPGAPLSPIYLNIRPEGYKGGTLRPEDYELIADLLAEGVSEAGIGDLRYIAGIPEAGEPIADALFAKLKRQYPGLEQLHLLKEQDESGRRIAGIEEELTATGRILLVDDLITGADTKLESITVCEAADLEVAAVAVLVDRGQGGSDEVRREGYVLIAPLTLPVLLDYYVLAGRLALQKAHDVAIYLRASKN